MEKYYTLSQISKSIQRMLHKHAPELWVVAEIAEFSYKRGHCYLDLVQKEEGQQISARMRANVWAGQLTLLRQKLGNDLDHLIQQGNKILVLASIQYHELYGLSLQVLDINASFTMGELELRRQQVIQQMEAEGLFLLQKRLRLPLVIQKIALVSSKEAAGYEDFIKQIYQNANALHFEVVLFPTLVQGERAVKEILVQLAKINPEQFDVIVLLRGGGSRLDLEIFNRYELAAFIARLPLPVLTGIGHHKDESVCDITAHTALKTPTAVANFLLDHNLAFLHHLEDVFERIILLANQMQVYEQNRLEAAYRNIARSVGYLLEQEKLKLHSTRHLVQSHAKSLLRTQQLKLDGYLQKARLLDPENVLARGYSLTLSNGKLAKAIHEGDEITTLTSLQEITSIVKETKKRNNGKQL